MPPERDPVPHINDRSEFGVVAEVLDAPHPLVRAQWRNGRLDLTMSPGQRKFTSLLIKALLSPRESNPWDHAVGRRLTDLVLYEHSVFAARDRFILAAAAHDRVAAYLLPFVQTSWDGGAVIAGIPGLRLNACRRHSYELVHLPTGGVLEVFDSQWRDQRNPDTPASLRYLDFELKTTRADKGVEQAEQWALDLHYRDSPLLATVGARLGLWWQHGGFPRLIGNAGATTLGSLKWERGPSAEWIAQHIESRNMHTPGLIVHRAQQGRRWMVFELHNETLMVEGPGLGRR